MPFSGDDVDRLAAWSWIRSRYAAAHPGWKVVEAPHEPVEQGGERLWSKARAVNRAVENLDAELLVIADADLFVPASAFIDATWHLGRRHWVVPYGAIHRLGIHETRRVLDSEPWRGFGPPARRELECKPYPGQPGGGILMVRREAWELVGGFDPRFVGWGGEDTSLGIALDTLAGPHLRLAAPLFHLWHAPVSRFNSPAYLANLRLQAAYVGAAGDPDAMRALIGQRDNQG